MAKGKCSDCGHSMSNTAEFCPHCGCTLRALEERKKLVVCEWCKGKKYYKSKIKIPGEPRYGSTIDYWTGNPSDTACRGCYGKGEVEITYL